jgi:hypothetical protein
MDDPYWEVANWTLSVSLDEQAAFIPQVISVALAAGAERVAVYKLKDTEDDRAANPEPFGLMRWDNSRRPAFDTYRVAIGLLNGVTTAERERWDAVGQVRLDGEGETTTVLFARLPQPQRARVRAVAEAAELVDMWGRRQPIEARGGFYVVDLPGALCTQTIADFCMIGGTTYYLIQESEAAQPPEREHFPPADEHMQPTKASPAVKPSPTSVPTPTPEPVPGANSRPTMIASPTQSPAASPAHDPAETTEPAVGDLVAGNSVGGDTAPVYLGLVVLGLGLALGVGLAGWWFAGRRAG